MILKWLTYRRKEKSGVYERLKGGENREVLVKGYKVLVKQGEQVYRHMVQHCAYS